MGEDTRDSTLEGKFPDDIRDEAVDEAGEQLGGGGGGSKKLPRTVIDIDRRGRGHVAPIISEMGVGTGDDLGSGRFTQIQYDKGGGGDATVVDNTSGALGVVTTEFSFESAFPATGQNLTVSLINPNTGGSLYARLYADLAEKGYHSDYNHSGANTYNGKTEVASASVFFDSGQTTVTYTGVNRKPLFSVSTSGGYSYNIMGAFNKTLNYSLRLLSSFSGEQVTSTYAATTRLNVYPQKMDIFYMGNRITDNAYQS